MPTRPMLRLLHIEECENDCVPIRHSLARAGYEIQWERVPTRATLEQALDRQTWDVIISDYALPNFSALAALAILKQRGLDIPFIVVSGALGEETAVSAMRAGAHDYLMKHNLARLAPAIDRELHECALRQEHLRAQAMLRASEKLASLSRLASTIAHEVNNPLEAVTNLLYLLNGCQLNHTARHYLNLAAQELQRLSYVVRQSLAFTRMESDQTPVPVSEIVEQILQLYSPRIQAGAVTVATRFEHDARVPAELRQVVSSLVVNAVDAVGNGGTVWVHLARAAAGFPEPGLRLVIADNGTGIAPEHRRELFQPFFSTKQERGNGLGLWVAKEIVQKYGGSIHVRSSIRPGRSGTAFSVFIPAACAGLPPSPVPKKRAASAAA